MTGVPWIVRLFGSEGIGMSDDDKWKTTAVVPLAPGITTRFGNNDFPVVCLMLQEKDTKTRVMPGALDGSGGKLIDATGGLAWSPSAWNPRESEPIATTED